MSPPSSNLATLQLFIITQITEKSYIKHSPRFYSCIRPQTHLVYLSINLPIDILSIYHRSIIDLLSIYYSRRSITIPHRALSRRGPASPSARTCTWATRPVCWWPEQGRTGTAKGTRPWRQRGGGGRSASRRSGDLCLVDDGGWGRRWYN